jgi:hypothetical protein
MLVYLEEYRNRRIARAAAAEVRAEACAGNSMPEIRPTAPVFSFPKASRGAGENILEHALDRVYALASRV